MRFLLWIYDRLLKSLLIYQITKIPELIRRKWRPGRDLDPGPAGDSRIYWARLYYLGSYLLQMA